MPPPASRRYPLTESPIKEFTILTKVLTGDLARMDKEGWNVEYMQFSEGGDLRAVFPLLPSYSCPQPERTAAKVVTPDAVIFETSATQADPAAVALEEAGFDRRPCPWRRRRPARSPFQR